MLELLNHCPYGYVAAPVIPACKGKGLFQLLNEEGSLSLDQLSKRLGVNDGHPKVALRILRSLQWISCSGNRAYFFKAKSESYVEIPKEELDLYNFSMDFYLKQARRRRRPCKWINPCSTTLECIRSPNGELLDSVLGLTLLIALKRHDLGEDN